MAHLFTQAAGGFYTVKASAVRLMDSSDILVEFDIKPLMAIFHHPSETIDVIDLNSGLVFTQKDGAIPLWEYKDYAINTNHYMKVVGDDYDELLIVSKAYDQLVSTFPDFEKKQAQYLNIKMKIKE